MLTPTFLLRALPVFALVLGAALAPACGSTPAAYDLPDDDVTDGFGGDTGAGGAGSVECAALEPSGGSCAPVDPTSLCQACVEAECCAEQEACNSTAPATTCAFGSTLFDGSPVEGGEIGCMMECFASRTDEGVLGPTSEDVTSCSDQCAASECGADDASPATEALAACILGLNENEGCAQQCGFLP